MYALFGTSVHAPLPVLYCNLVGGSSPVESHAIFIVVVLADTPSLLLYLLVFRILSRTGGLVVSRVTLVPGGFHIQDHY